MHIRTKLLGMMIFAALASAVLVFSLFFFLQREIATSAGKNLRQIYSDSWYNLYSNAVLDIGDIMVAITSFGSELDVEGKYTNFSEARKIFSLIFKLNIIHNTMGKIFYNYRVFKIFNFILNTKIIY